VGLPVALTIAGSDSGGGAGIQADLKTFHNFEVYGASVITAITAQNTCEVRQAEPVRSEMIAAQLAAVCEDLEVRAAKTGMLWDAAVVATVAEAVQRYQLERLVVDPVIVSKSGDRLLQPQGIKALREVLMPLALLITPNLPEAAELLQLGEAQVASDPVSACRALAQFGSSAVLLKGGHGNTAEAIDILYSRDSVTGAEEITELRAVRYATKNTHGTGCTLSAAITALLARGFELRDAVQQAKRFITAAIASADRIGVGSGHGPVDHWIKLSSLD